MIFPQKNWSVSIVGDTVNEVLPMLRGGYFVLPDLPDAEREKAKLMFNSQTREKFVGVAWSIKHSNNTLSYQAFSQALDEVKIVQSKIGWLEGKINFYEEKQAVFNALKVCFKTVGGQVLLQDELVENSTTQRCVKLKFDQSLLTTNPQIRFNGEVETLTLSFHK